MRIPTPTIIAGLALVLTAGPGVVHADHPAYRVAEFMISGTGGPAVHDGPSLTESHAPMHLTDADFLAAGGDVVQALTNLGYGQDEIDQVICILVSLRDQAVLAPAADAAASK